MASPVVWVRALAGRLRAVPRVARGKGRARLMLLLQVQAYAAGPFTWETDVDSTVWRAHGTQLVSAGTAPAEGRPAGRARAGRPRAVQVPGRVHREDPLACEHVQKPFSLLVMMGRRGDSPQSEPVHDPGCQARPGAYHGADPASTWGQGVLLPSEPRLPVQFRDLVHDPGIGSRIRHPQVPRSCGWSPSLLACAPSRMRHGGR